MFKSMIKELAIFILLIIAIGLIFVIVFYDYNTVNTTVPKKVEAYELSDGVKEELNDSLQVKDTQELVKTYILDETDLRRYEAKNTYDRGKPNPFSTYIEATNEGESEEDGSGEGGKTTENNGTSTSSGDEGKLSNGVKGK